MNASPLGLTALAVVVLLLMATAVRQAFGLGRWSIVDTLGILPGWRFFRQASGEYDLAIAVRGGLDQSDFTPWQDIAIGGPRKSRQWIWYPEAMQEHAVWLALDALDRRHAAGRDADADSSLAYATVLAFARTRVSAAGYAAIQFAVVRQANGLRTMTFSSAVHPC